jgi:hypothetical protein
MLTPLRARPDPTLGTSPEMQAKAPMAPGMGGAAPMPAPPMSGTPPWMGGGGDSAASSGAGTYSNFAPQISGSIDAPPMQSMGAAPAAPWAPPANTSDGGGRGPRTGGIDPWGGPKVPPPDPWGGGTLDPLPPGGNTRIPPTGSGFGPLGGSGGIMPPGGGFAGGMHGDPMGMGGMNVIGDPAGLRGGGGGRGQLAQLLARSGRRY